MALQQAFLLGFLLKARSERYSSEMALVCQWEILHQLYQLWLGSGQMRCKLCGIKRL